MCIDTDFNKDTVSMLTVFLVWASEENSHILILLEKYEFDEDTLVFSGTISVLTLKVDGI